MGRAQALATLVASAPTIEARDNIDNRLKL